jgi:subtilisin family serine protease
LVRAGYLAPDLQATLAQAFPDEKLKVIVRMVEETDISVFPPGQREAMVQHLKDFASRSQRDILASLPAYGDKVAKVKPFWIYNGIFLEATKEVILALAKRPDVGYIEEDKVIQVEPLQEGKSEPKPSGIEWNIDRIQAPQVWALGYTGQGIVVGNIDTGVMVSHETFGSRWRGGTNSWFDAVNDSSIPYDDHFHGTWTMGIICGGSTADSIGVAPGATFVAAKAFTGTTRGQISWVDACYQWFAGLGSAAPSVVSNSWGYNPDSAGTHFWQESRNLQVMGIHQVYGNGNYGPLPGTTIVPAAYPHQIGVGATSPYQDTLAVFSSRGPSPPFGAIESSANYLDPNWASSRRKPDLSAPGVNVRSSYIDGGYRAFNGTSGSCPHVAGAIALMLQKNPNLTDQQIWEILTSTCDTPSAGNPYPNQNYGWGRLNAYRAVMATPASPQFRITPVDQRITLKPDSSTVDSLAVISFGAFNLPVTFVLDSIRPPEPTISVGFNPNPVTPPPNGEVKTGMQVATHSTPERDYVLFYHGIGDTLTRTGYVNLWVTTPTFVLTSTPRSRTVIWGDDSTTYRDSVISIFGFNNPCTLSAEVNPPSPGITLSFYPDNIVIPTDGRRMQARVNSTPVGTYRITVTARSGSIARTVDDTLVVRISAQGPDPYGYFAYDNTDTNLVNAPVYAWLEINPNRGGSGTSVGPGGLDVTYQHGLGGIGVKHYGSIFDSVSICAHGWLAMGICYSTSGVNYAIPSTYFVPNGIAPFWADLRTDIDTSSWWFYPDLINRRFIVEWDSVPQNFAYDKRETFQVIIYDTALTPRSAPTHDSEIILQWKEVRDTSLMTVGQQNTAMNVGLNCYYNGTYDPAVAPIGAGRAIKFTTDPPRLRTGVELNPLRTRNLPLRFALGPIVPNPTSGLVGISYELPENAQVMLKAYNITGQLIKVLVSEPKRAGSYQKAWDGRDDRGRMLPAGMYLIRLEAGKHREMSKMVLIR